MKNIKKYIILINILIVLISISSCYKQEKEVRLDPKYSLQIGYEYYDKDDYLNAIDYLIYAAQNGITDGILYYRIAYSGEQLDGLSDNVKTIYRKALVLLTAQYPNDKYYIYAKNKVASFTPIKPSFNTFPFGIAENGDIYNFDNDGDGRREPVFVSGYYRKDGTYVRSHYRANPR